ncbi:MAG: SDR family NAD(P)-dependent oxidoreductase, partial [Verrucomicrobiota bacterium]
MTIYWGLFFSVFLLLGFSCGGAFRRAGAGALLMRIERDAATGVLLVAVVDAQDTYRKLFEVDVFGQIALTKEVLPIMVEQGSGHMAVTASVAGKLG